MHVQKRKVDPVDADLFRRAVGEVKAVPGGDRVVQSSRPAPVARKRLADDRAVVDELLSHELDQSQLETGEELLFQRDGIQKGVLRNLRRGQYVVEAELDLHGLSANQAREVLGGFLNECRGTGHRCVRIVHGKGRRSSNLGPVIKPLVNKWLRMRDEVLAFCSARPVDGGTGAVYVLLRKRQ